MATIVYLDTDDEITSAAARMRDADEGKVGLVVPYGSRLATSRINFRLLAREAQTRGRQLSIVAPDGATRALAASAGLPVFASVSEYETSIDAPGAPPAAAAAGAPKASGVVTPVAAAPEPAPSSEPAPPSESVPAQPRRRRPTPADDLEQTTAIVTPVASATASDAAYPTAPPPSARSSTIPSFRAPRLHVARPLLLLGVGALALAILVGGVAAYVFLPSATITLTPRQATVGPVVVEVRADPTATSVDVQAAVVPARRLTFDLEATDAFPATGRRIEETRASGEVIFENYDPISSNTIAAGSIVSTESGVEFRTVGAVTLPAGEFVIPSVKPSTARVGIEAVALGTAGNVAANTITAVPKGKNPIFLKVRNEEPTSGGSRRQFPRVVRADVDAAVEQLTTAIGRQFAERLADPASVPNGMTLFPETQALGDPAVAVDPASLVGREVESFELSMTAQGGVTAVDETPLEQIADARIRAAVDDDHTLVEDSIEIAFGEPTIDGDQILFPATASARQAPILDKDALLAEIRGRPVPQARSRLEAYGTVRVDVWPEWVTAIPTIESRVTFTIAPAVDPRATSRPSGSPSPSRASPSAAPSPSVTGSGG